MAEGKVEGAGKKSALSSRIMQMKFMQRGKDKPVSQEAVAEQVAQAKKEEEDNWVADGAGPSGCVVLVEGNPPPGAHMGHMSFNSFNPELEKLQEERTALLSNAKSATASTPDGNTDDGKATTDHIQQNRSSKADDQVIESMRSNRSRPHNTEKSTKSKSGNKRKRHKPS